MGIDIDPRTEHTLFILRDMVEDAIVVEERNRTRHPRYSYDEYAALLDAIQLIEGEQV